MPSPAFTIQNPKQGAAAASILSPLKPGGNLVAFNSITVPDNPTIFGSRSNAIMVTVALDGPIIVNNNKQTMEYVRYRCQQASEELTQLNDTIAVSLGLSAYIEWMARHNDGRFTMMMTLQDVCRDLLAFMQRLPDDLGQFSFKVIDIVKSTGQKRLISEVKLWPLRLAFLAAVGTAGASKVSADKAAETIGLFVLQELAAHERAQFLGQRVNFAITGLRQQARASTGCGTPKTWRINWDASALHFMPKPSSIARGGMAKPKEKRKCGSAAIEDSPSAMASVKRQKRSVPTNEPHGAHATPNIIGLHVNKAANGRVPPRERMPIDERQRTGSMTQVVESSNPKQE